MKILNKFSKHRYPMTVQEFQQLAEQCSYTETKAWHWLTEKRIAEALDKIAEAYKLRLLIAKDKPKTEWRNIDVPRFNGKGILRGSQVPAIHQAVQRLVWELHPLPSHLGPSGQSFDLGIYCPECNVKLKLKIQMMKE